MGIEFWLTEAFSRIGLILLGVFLGGLGWELGRFKFLQYLDPVVNHEAVELAVQLQQQLEVSERKRVIESAQAEALELLKAAEHEANVRKADILEVARLEVVKVIEAGKKQLDDERVAMLIAARKDLVDIAVKAAAKIVTEGLTERKSQSMAEEVIRKLT